MKLFSVALITYVVHAFALPVAIGFVGSFIPVGIPIWPVSFLIFLILIALAAYLYARWAGAGLDPAGSITVGAVFLAVPAFMYLLSWFAGYFQNPVIAVEDLQSALIPIFDQIEGGDFSIMLAWAPQWIPYALPFFLGPYLAGFFIKSQAVEEARIIL